MESVWTLWKSELVGWRNDFRRLSVFRQWRTRAKPRHFPLERVVDQLLFFYCEMKQHRHGFDQLHCLDTHTNTWTDTDTTLCRHAGTTLLWSQQPTTGIPTRHRPFTWSDMPEVWWKPADLRTLAH